jgi:UDP-2,4-diacetamido-2,4,6-trideoxy-beta-L-altropyranose hydrolase
MLEPPRILFAPAPTAVGGGHLMRCLSLAQALAARGAAPTFVLAGDDARLVARFAPGLDPAVIRPADLAVTIRRGGCDAVVVDDYGVMEADEHTLRRYGAPVIMVVDDLADRPHLADLVLDPGYGRGVKDYAGLVPAHSKVMAGPAYALLRPAFAAARDEARAVRETPQRVFVSFGLSDVGAVTIRALDVVRALLPEACFDVAVGAEARSLHSLKALAARDPGVVLHVETTEVAALMAEADLAVGAGGGGVWERCCLGLPSIAVIVADNQRETVEALAADGVLDAVDMDERDWEQALSDAFVNLMAAEPRRRLRHASLALCDGRGAERAADALLARLIRR